MHFLKILFYLLSAFAIITVFLPFIRKDHWAFRIFDYPRMQKFILIAILGLTGYYFFSSSELLIDKLNLVVLTGCFVHLAYVIHPFTPLGKKMIKHVKVKPGDDTLDVLVSNVFQYNQEYQRVLELIERRNPDIVFLVETDQKWMDAVIGLREKFPHYIEIPKDNTYGLLFYSKLPIENHSVQYLIDQEIPSIIAEVSLNGNPIKIFGLHPTPPVPMENRFSTDRDAEILIVGKMAKKEKLPCLVIGDLNDVAWSYTTELFLKTSGLLDPRRGRGMYNTFHTRYPLLRWPLDHFFVSGHFRLVKIKVEDHVGSDHFPISICLALSTENDRNQLSAKTKDRELAEEKIEAGVKGQHR